MRKLSVAAENEVVCFKKCEGKQSRKTVRFNLKFIVDTFTSDYYHSAIVVIVYLLATAVWKLEKKKKNP